MNGNDHETSHAALATLLVRTLQGLPFTLPQSIDEPLLAYLDLLLRWNRVYNLTSVRDPVTMIPLHVADSLAVMPYLFGTAILDVGSGAGLPGIPLALACPERRFTLLDSDGKKIRFITQVLYELHIDNAEAVQMRAEEHRPASGYDTVMARGFAALPALLKTIAPLCAPGACVLALKGRYPTDELQHLPTTFELMAVHALDVPGVDATRHAVILRFLP